MSPVYRPIIITPDVEAKLDRYSEMTDSGCVEWRRGINTTGYGMVYIGGRNFYAHRANYTRHKGQIPDGFHLDHLCRNTKCINPDHLEAVTPQTNMLRGESPGAIAQRRDACKRGHLYAEFGKIWAARRHCTACNAIHLAAYKERRRAA